jgi:hypothetical protein
MNNSDMRILPLSQYHNNLNKSKIIYVKTVPEDIMTDTKTPVRS